MSQLNFIMNYHTYCVVWLRIFQDGLLDGTLEGRIIILHLQVRMQYSHFYMLYICLLYQSTYLQLLFEILQDGEDLPCSDTLVSRHTQRRFVENPHGVDEVFTLLQAICWHSLQSGKRSNQVHIHKTSMHVCSVSISFQTLDFGLIYTVYLVFIQSILNRCWVYQGFFFFF